MTSHTLTFMATSGYSTTIGRMSDSQSRGLYFKSSCCNFEANPILFAPLCPNKLSCINVFSVPGYRQWWISVTVGRDMSSSG